MKLEYDSEADILFIELRPAPAADSVDIEEGVTALLDEQGHIVGIELLDASERLGPEQLHNVTLKNLGLESLPLQP